MHLDCNLTLMQREIKSTKFQLLCETESSVLRLSPNDVSHPVHKTSLFHYQRHTGKLESTRCLTPSGRTLEHKHNSVQKARKQRLTVN